MEGHRNDSSRLNKDVNSDWKVLWLNLIYSCNELTEIKVTLSYEQECPQKALKYFM